MKKLNVFFLIFLFVLAGQQVSSQLLVKEDFNYSTGNLAGKTNPWTNTVWTNGTNFNVSIASLQYTGYSGGGNKVQIAQNSATTGTGLAFTQSGTAYCAFLFRPIKGSTETDEKQMYFLGLYSSVTTSSSSWRGVLFVKHNTATNKCFIGLGSSITGRIWTTQEYDYNNTYLLVLKYEVITGNNNDKIYLAINPVTNLSEPSTWDLQVTNSGDINPGAIHLRGRNSGAVGHIVDIGGIRIAKSWADLFEPINSSVNKLQGFQYNLGNGPSAEQSFTVSGSNLTGDITVTPPTDFEISTTSGSGFTSGALTLTQTGGVVATTTLYVRMKGGLAVGTYSGENIVLSSTGYNSVNVACSGTVVTPTISSTPTSISNLNYTVGHGPSNPQSFNVSGTYLTDNIAVTPPANFEISSDNVTYQATAITLNQVSGNVASTPIYVRLKAGLSLGNYSGNVALTSTGATEVDVAVSGTVGSPTISSTPTSISNLNYEKGHGPSDPQTFNVSGTYLTDNIAVTPPANFEISSDNVTYQATAITLTQVSGTVASTPIYVRLKAGLVAGSYSGSIALTSAGATQVNVAVSGDVGPATSNANVKTGEVTMSIQQGKLWITGTKAGEKIEIFNITGSKTVSMLSNGNTTAVPMTSKGIYLVKAGSTVKKIVY